MNFLAQLEKGVFKDPFYQSILPTFPLAVAWILDLGFLHADVLAPLQSNHPALFLSLALVWHTVQIVVAFYVARSLLAMLVQAVIDAEYGGRWLFVILNALALSLINVALLGAALGAAQLLGATERVTGPHPVLAMLAGINFLWYVAAFLTGRELLQLMMPERAAAPTARAAETAGSVTSKG
jgi:hypothetical protein